MHRFEMLVSACDVEHRFCFNIGHNMMTLYKNGMS